MNYLYFITVIFGISCFSFCSANCTDSDKMVIKDCYNTHLKVYNYTAKLYEYVFTVLRFTSLDGKNNCTVFEALGNCIGEEKFNNCVTPETLANILGKSWDDAKDLIYIYRRFRIYCSYFPQLLATYSPAATTCYDSASINTCAYERLALKKSNSSNNCNAYPSYVDCSVKYIAGRCREKYAQMHCDFMNLIIPTYHSYCGLKPFNCSKYNYTEEKILGSAEFNQVMSVYGYFNVMYNKYVEPSAYYSRFLLASIFIVIFNSILKKNSALNSSFFVLFLLIPLYDIVYVVVFILQLFPAVITLYASILVYLEDCYGTLMPFVLLLMSLNRFTAINFPLRHRNIWKPYVTAISVTIIIFLTILISVTDNIAQVSTNLNFVNCQRESSLHCILKENFDMDEFYTKFKWFRCLLGFSTCGLSLILLCITIINYECCLKNQSDFLKTAEKRLVFITLTEVVLTVPYIICYNFPIFARNFDILFIPLHTKPVMLLHHFASVALFFIFSQATRNAYIQFFYLDVLYKKCCTKYPFLKFTQRKDRVVTIGSLK